MNRKKEKEEIIVMGVMVVIVFLCLILYGMFLTTETTPKEKVFQEVLDPTGCVWLIEEGKLFPKLNAKGERVCPGKVTSAPYIWEEK